MNLAVLAMVVVLACAASAQDTYTIKSRIDIDAILKSDRLLEGYHKCLIDQGPCTSEGLQLKKIIPEALSTKCAKCTDAQKNQAAKVVKFLKSEKPNIWKELMDKFDPDGKLRAAAKNDPELKKFKIVS